MVTIATAVLAIGYTLFYVGGSNLAHGPGKGVGFTEALGLTGTSNGSTSPATSATSAKRATGSGAPKPGGTRAVKQP